MVHRKSSGHMFKQMEDKSFVGDKTVVMQKCSGEFGFRIHGSRPVVVSAIEPGTPAQLSGLQVGDIIVAINGSRVLESSHGDVVRIAHAASDELQLEVASTSAVLPVPESWSCARQGWLWRRSGSSGVWCRRWAVLKPDALLFLFKRAEDVHPVSGLSLADCTVSTSVDCDRDMAFTIECAGAESVVLSAESEEEYEVWVETLRNAMEESASARYAASCGLLPAAAVVRTASRPEPPGGVQSAGLTRPAVAETRETALSQADQRTEPAVNQADQKTEPVVNQADQRTDPAVNQADQKTEPAVNQADQRTEPPQDQTDLPSELVLGQTQHDSEPSPKQTGHVPALGQASQSFVSARSQEDRRFVSAWSYGDESFERPPYEDGDENHEMDLGQAYQSFETALNQADRDYETVLYQTEQDCKLTLGEGERDSEPALNQVEHDSEPALDHTEHDSEPTPDQAEHDSKPALSQVEHDSEPAVDHAEYDKPALDQVEYVSEPALDEAEHRSEPTLGQAEHSETALDRADYASEPALDQAGHDSEPALDQAECDSEPALGGVKPVSEPAMDQAEHSSETALDQVEYDSESVLNQAGYDSEPVLNKAEHESEPALDEAEHEYGQSPIQIDDISGRAVKQADLGSEQAVKEADQRSEPLLAAVCVEQEGGAWQAAVRLNAAGPPAQILKPDCAGFLSRLGFKWRRWTRLYCVLKDGVLYFYRTDCDTAAFGSVYLHGYRVQSSSVGGGRRPSFEVCPPISRLRHFYFIADSDNDRKRWLAALEYSIDRWIKVAT